MDQKEVKHTADAKRTLHQQLDAIGWGLFLIWMGTAFLTNMSWGIGLVGVGLILLGGQAARRFVALPVEWFWLLLGMAFLVWGALEELQIQFSAGVFPGGLLPILFIAAGIALIISALFRKKSEQ